MIKGKIIILIINIVIDKINNKIVSVSQPEGSETMWQNHSLLKVNE